MIDRNVAMAILGALPDDKILQALRIAGVAPVDASQGMAGLAMDGSGQMGSADNKITPWSEKQVGPSGQQDRPSLVDKMWAKPMTNAQTPVQGGGMEGTDPYLQTGGM